MLLIISYSHARPELASGIFEALSLSVHEVRGPALESHPKGHLKTQRKRGIWSSRPLAPIPPRIREAAGACASLKPPRGWSVCASSLPPPFLASPLPHQSTLSSALLL